MAQNLMFNNSISITKNSKVTDSYGRILSNACKRTILTTLDCTAMQRVNSNSHLPSFEMGWEGRREIGRWDSKSYDISTVEKVSLGDYIEFTDERGKRHEYKLIDFKTSTLLGCTWISVYGENLQGRDITEKIYVKQNLQSIP